MGEACNRAPDLEIAEDLPVGIRIHKLASGFHEAKDEATKIQVALNLQITELQLKSHPSTPPEVIEQWRDIIQSGWEKIARAM